MSATLFKKVDYSLSKLIHDIDQGEIGLPDIQRAFVWETAKVRDLFDSMYKGFPVGYLLFWSNDHMNGTRQIGAGGKQVKVARLLIVDGQQRLTSLFAVLKGQPVLTKDYKHTTLNIAFRPRDCHFEVTDAAIRRDPEYIFDISKLWSGEVTRGRFVKDFIAGLRHTREVSDAEEDSLAESIDHLYDIQNYPLTAMEISSTVNEEQVAEIFVRINSKGVTLKQADFILTLLSVFWDDGRAQLEKFCRDSRHPSTTGPSPFNYFIQPDPDELLRVCVGVGFKRARLQHVYSILRGKDLDTGEFSDQRRDAQFEVLKAAQTMALDLTNWHEFHKVLIRAGFRSGSMITSTMSMLYAYAMFLIGRCELRVEAFKLRDLMARWFFMTTLTGRYTGSPETVMETDLANLRNLKSGDDFVAKLDQVIRDALTDDFWSITLPNDMETPSARTPGLFAYHAALNLLDARVLFSKMKVSELLDPALKANKSPAERHHLFPKGYLASLGITEVRDTNQIANYALVEWDDNIGISDTSPAEYWPLYAARFQGDDLKQMMLWHALPDGWEKMEYKAFLAERRSLMANIIRDGFGKLVSVADGARASVVAEPCNTAVLPNMGDSIQDAGIAVGGMDNDEYAIPDEVAIGPEHTVLWDTVAEAFSRLNLQGFTVSKRRRHPYLQVLFRGDHMHYEWVVLKRDGYLGVSLHFESGVAETNLKRLNLVKAKEESIREGVGYRFVAEPWGRKWAHAEFRLPFQGDSPSPALAAEAAALMKTLIERTYPLIVRAD
jgi:hypothetical protein